MSFDLYLAFDLLETRLLDGCYIGRQDGSWWLFNADGDGICSGVTLRDLMVNLIFTDN
jgi:hypothetical protein